MPRAVRARDLPASWSRDDRVFRALADATRRRILILLGNRELRAGDIAHAFAVSRPAISKHLRVLREADLVTVRVTGRERWYAVAPAPLAEAAAVVADLDSHWRVGLARLGEHLAAEAAESDPDGG